jgi:SAM-dependent methyltransferase
MTDLRQTAAAALRNRDPILAVLREVLPATGLVLEVASGTGEHAVHFARALPELVWQPSDPSPGARDSIAAWIAEQGGPNLRAPLALDAACAQWPVDAADAIVCINMIHISPWEAGLGLMRGAERILPPGGALALYGPFRRTGRELEPGNATFDASLRARDPRWGLRELGAVEAAARDAGLTLDRVTEMPANNLTAVFRKD